MGLKHRIQSQKYQVLTTILALFLPSMVLSNDTSKLKHYKCATVLGDVEMLVPHEPGLESLHMWRGARLPRELASPNSGGSNLYELARAFRSEFVFGPLFHKTLSELLENESVRVVTKYSTGQQVNDEYFSGEFPPFDEGSNAVLLQVEKPLRVARFHKWREGAYKSGWFKPLERSRDMHLAGEVATQNNALPKDSEPDHYSELTLQAGDYIILGAVRPQLAAEHSTPIEQGFFTPFGDSENMQFYRPLEVKIDGKVVKQDFLTEKNVELTLPTADIDYKFSEYLQQTVEAKSIVELEKIKEAFHARIDEYWGYLPPRTKHQANDAWSVPRKSEIALALREMEQYFRSRWLELGGDPLGKEIAP
ncbi:hypothetical protein GW915_12650 [bacterium]|nr:hypothetical protein [bacterium]